MNVFYVKTSGLAWVCFESIRDVLHEEYIRCKLVDFWLLRPAQVTHKGEQCALPLKAVRGFRRQQEAHGVGDFSSLGACPLSCFPSHEEGVHPDKFAGNTSGGDGGRISPKW